MEKEGYIENEYAEIWLENGIIHNKFKPNFVITIDVAKKLVAERLKVNANIDRPLFVDLTNFVSIDTESRKYLSKGDAIKNVSAGAFLVGNNPISVFAANIFITVDRPKTPVKVFGNKGKALKWLEKYK